MFKAHIDKNEIKVAEQKLVNTIRDKFSNIADKTVTNIKDQSNDNIKPNIEYGKDYIKIVTHNPDEIKYEEKHGVFKREWQKLPSVIEDAFK